MKMKIDTKSFVDAVSWATKTFDAKDEKAYISLIVDTETNEGRLTHMNVTSFLKANIQILDLSYNRDETENDLLFYAIDGQYLHRLASSLNGVTDPIVLEQKTLKSDLTLATVNGKFTVPTFNTMVPKEPKIEEVGEVDDREFFDAMQRLAKVSDPANAGQMPALGAIDIKFDLEEKKIKLMSTDRYVLAETMIDFEPTDYTEEFLEYMVEETSHENVMFPVSEASKISPSKGITTSTSIVYERKGQKFGYKFADGRVAVFSLKDGNPINYSKIREHAKGELDHTVIVGVSDWKKAIQTVSNLSWEENELKIEFNSDEIVIYDMNKKNNVAIQAVESNVEGEVLIPFSRIVLNKSIQPVSTSQISISWKDTGRFIIKQILDDGEVLDSSFVMAVSVKTS